MEISDPDSSPERGRAETATEEPFPETLEEIEEMEADAPLVGIIMGSKSDMDTMRKAEETLEENGIRYEVRVMSAHRDPETVSEYCKAAKMRGMQACSSPAQGCRPLFRASPPPTPSCR